MSAAGISLRGVVKTYGSTIALAGLDLDLVPGEIFGVAGPNGAGKSTLVRIIAGEERPTRGSLTFDGRNWSPADEWQDVAVVHQEPQLFQHGLVLDELGLVDDDHGVAALAEVPEEDVVEPVQQLGLARLRRLHAQLVERLPQEVGRVPARVGGVGASWCPT